jgi:dihydroorotate dehydrogenase
MEEIRNYNFDGVISSNTTIDKTLLKDCDAQGLSGGLSGKPLYEKSNALLSELHSIDPNILKIGVGGVFTQEDFSKKINLGASLVQIYTSFIYEGPRIVSKLLQ